MISIEKEEKLLKGLGVFVLLVLLPFQQLSKNENLSLDFVYILLAIMSVLTFRKYSRDKREGKDLSKYKMLLAFLMLTIVISVISLYSI